MTSYLTSTRNKGLNFRDKISLDFSFAWKSLLGVNRGAPSSRLFNCSYYVGDSSSQTQVKFSAYFLPRISAGGKKSNELP